MAENATDSTNATRSDEITQRRNTRIRELYRIRRAAETSDQREERRRLILTPPKKVTVQMMLVNIILLWATDHRLTSQ